MPKFDQAVIETPKAPERKRLTLRGARRRALQIMERAEQGRADAAEREAEAARFFSEHAPL